MPKASIGYFGFTVWQVYANIGEVCIKIMGFGCDFGFLKEDIMKKVLATTIGAVVLCATLGLGLSACGKAEPAAENTVQETTATDTATTTEAEPATEEQATEEASTEEVSSEAEASATESAGITSLPEIKGTSGGMDYELVGLDITKAYDEGSAIRLWFKVTNTSNSLRYPNYIVGAGGISCSQNGETLIGTSLLEEQFEDTIAGCDILPETTVVYTEKYEMLNESDIVTVHIQDSANEYNFDVDPASFAAVIPEPFTLAPVASSDWFQPVSDEIDFSDIHIKVVGCELIKGTPWIGSDELDCVRVT